MNLFLGHTTACLFWRTATPEQCNRAVPTCAVPSSLSARTPQKARLLAEGTPFHGMHLHLMAPAGCGAKSAEDITIHAPKTTTHLSYRKVSRDVFVSSPELTFVQMAGVLALPELVLLGTEFCGCYAKNEFSPTGIIERGPLTTPKRLCQAVESAGKFSGKERARQALRAIYANTASPKECEIAVRLGLFNNHGGYGLRDFKCNYRIEIPRALKHLTSKSYFKADFCWPQKKVIVEYDSDLHTGSEKIAQDAMRRNFLTAQGYTLIGIARIQGSDELELDRVAEEIARALGVHRKPRCSNFLLKKRELARIARRWTLADPKDYHDMQEKNAKKPI